MVGWGGIEGGDKGGQRRGVKGGWLSCWEKMRCFLLVEEERESVRGSARGYVPPLLGNCVVG